MPKLSKKTAEEVERDVIASINIGIDFTTSTADNNSPISLEEVEKAVNELKQIEERKPYLLINEEDIPWFTRLLKENMPKEYLNWDMFGFVDFSLNKWFDVKVNKPNIKGFEPMVGENRFV
jgi:hypothetical protein